MKKVRGNIYTILSIGKEDAYYDDRLGFIGKPFLFLNYGDNREGSFIAAGGIVEEIRRFFLAVKLSEKPIKVMKWKFRKGQKVKAKETSYQFKIKFKKRDVTRRINAGTGKANYFVDNFYSENNGEWYPETQLEKIK